MFNHVRRVAGVAFTTAALFIPAFASAQTRQFEACSQGALRNCAGIRLTSALGAGPSNTNRLDISLQNLGSLASPSLATSLYFASFLTGLNPAVTPVDVLPAPVSSGGATILSATPWSLFESGDAIVLQPAGNDGIGGCVFGAPTGGFGLMGQTCGANQFITFSFFTTRAFNLNAITVAGLEFVALDRLNTSDSCNDLTPCTVRAVSTVPEPSSLALLLAGASALVVMRFRRRDNRTEV